MDSADRDVSLWSTRSLQWNPTSCAALSSVKSSTWIFAYGSQWKPVALSWKRVVSITTSWPRGPGRWTLSLDNTSAAWWSRRSRTLSSGSLWSQGTPRSQRRTQLNTGPIATSQLFTNRPRSTCKRIRVSFIWRRHKKCQDTSWPSWRQSWESWPTAAMTRKMN